jgi:hypothetical protein
MRSLRLGLARAAAAAVTMTLGLGAAHGDGVLPVTARQDATVGGTEDTKGGAANGMVTVDAFTGHIQSSYAFVVPPGRAGVTPSLGLSYSSAGGRRFAGRSWTLGLPSIERRTRSGPPRFRDPAPGSPVNPDETDLFYFAGQRLVPICLVGAGGECRTRTEEIGLGPDAPAPDLVKEWHHFRLAEEGAFLRFFASPDFRTWMVQSKSGATMELGAPLDGSDDGGLDVHQPQGQPYRWNLVRQYDAQRDASGFFPVNRVVYKRSTRSSRARCRCCARTRPAAPSRPCPLRSRRRGQRSGRGGSSMIPSGTSSGSRGRATSRARGTSTTRPSPITR